MEYYLFVMPLLKRNLTDNSQYLAQDFQHGYILDAIDLTLS